jgi:hypothetical protein
VFTVSSPTAWGNEKFVQSGFHMCSMMTQGAMHVLATAHLQHWEKEGNAFLNCMLKVDESWMHSFDSQLKWQNAEWHAQTSQSKKTVWHSQVL